MPSPSPRWLLATVMALALTPALHAQSFETSRQQISVAVPLYEAAESDQPRLENPPAGLREQEWTETVRFVTNRPGGSSLYVSVEGDLYGGTLAVEPVVGSQVVRQHQPAWSAGTLHAVQFESAGEQVLVSGLRLVLASMDVRIRLTSGAEAPGPLRIDYRVGE
ncbi:MAG: hypothetical protein HKN04_08885 [Rhodothermaceae bacterium]|nr:hypothetical protein [Rhodothermaceae bacterium]